MEQEISFTVSEIGLQRLLSRLVNWDRSVQKSEFSRRKGNVVENIKFIDGQKQAATFSRVRTSDKKYLKDAKMVTLEKESIKSAPLTNFDSATFTSGIVTDCSKLGSPDWSLEIVVDSTHKQAESSKYSLLSEKLLKKPSRSIDDMILKSKHGVATIYLRKRVENKSGGYSRFGVPGRGGRSGRVTHHEYVNGSGDGGYVSGSGNKDVHSEKPEDNTLSDAVDLTNKLMSISNHDYDELGAHIIVATNKMMGRDNISLKQLAKPVIGLNKFDYQNTILPFKEQYYITEKADGVRGFIVGVKRDKKIYVYPTPRP